MIIRDPYDEPKPVFSEDGGVEIIVFYDRPVAFRRAAIWLPVPSSVTELPPVLRRPQPFTMVKDDGGFFGRWAVAEGTHGLYVGLVRERWFKQDVIERWMLVAINKEYADTDALCSAMNTAWERGEGVEATTVNGYIRRYQWGNRLGKDRWRNRSMKEG